MRTQCYDCFGVFFVIYYDFVIGIEGAAIETWGTFTFHTVTTDN